MNVPLCIAFSASTSAFNFFCNAASFASIRQPLQSPSAPYLPSMGCAGVNVSTRNNGKGGQQARLITLHSTFASWASRKGGTSWQYCTHQKNTSQLYTLRQEHSHSLLLYTY